MRSFLPYFLVVLSLTIVFYHSRFSDAQSANSSYTCKINQQCLNDLKKGLLERETDINIYQFCEDSYQNSQDCCANPSECQEDFGREAGQILKQSSLDFTQKMKKGSSCISNPGLASLFTQAQSFMCNEALSYCKSSCKSKLEELKDTFKRCFSIPPSDSIESAFKKARASSNQNCYREMEDIADKYRGQSLTGDSLFGDDLESEDIVDCEKIASVKTQQALKSFSVNICQQASAQKEEEEEESHPTQALESANQRGENTIQAGSTVHQDQKGADFNKQSFSGLAGSEKPKQTSTKSKSESNSALLTAGAVTGAVLGANDLKGKDSSSSKSSLKAKTAGSLTDKSQKSSVLSAVPDSSKTTPTEKSTKTDNKQAENKPANKKTDSKTTGKKTVKDSSKNSCPIPMPEIKSAVVYQSVEAPQIEPMDQQEKQDDPDKPMFLSYDLVQEKPAGVLVKLEKPYSSGKSDGLEKSDGLQGEFKLSLKIKNRAYSKCFHNPLSGIKMEDGNQSEKCYIEDSHFKEQIKDSSSKEQISHSFFGLKGNDYPLNREKDSIPVVVHLKADNYPTCQQKIEFKINVIKVHPLDLGFTFISDQECRKRKELAKQHGNRFRAYSSSKFNRHWNPKYFKSATESFIKSDEVFHYLQSMFPVHKVNSSFLNNKSGVKGDCDDENISWGYNIVSKGMLRDTLNLEEQRQEHGYHKLVAIVPNDYFEFHEKEYNLGMVVLPATEKKFESYNDMEGGFYLSNKEYHGGSQNIAFVTEDSLEKGVIAHELGHTFRQFKEHYETKSKCQRFNGGRIEGCKNEYRIPIALDTSIEEAQTSWRFIQGKYSIMNNTTASKKADLSDLWIDRETHQKVFKTLADLEGGVIPLKQDIAKQRENINKASQNQDLYTIRGGDISKFKASVSGYFYEKEQAFIVPQVKVKKTAVSSPSYLRKEGTKKPPLITFQLKEKNELLEEIKQVPVKMKAELFSKDGETKSVPFPASPFIVNLPLPKDYKKRNLRVSVLNPKGSTIYTAPVPKAKRSSVKTARRKPVVKNQNSLLASKRTSPQAIEAPMALTAQNLKSTSSNSCPVSMPEIKSAVVYQSVEAPQIEPMNEQNPVPYDDYDLVQGKPAGVLVYLNEGNMNRKRKFGLDIFIDGDSKYRQKCFHEPLKNQMVKGDEVFCSFTKNQLRKEGRNKFFILPIKEDFLNKELKDVPVRVTVYPIDFHKNKACLKQTTFKMNIKKTEDLSLAFVGIDGGNSCQAHYKLSPPQTIQSFVTSNEVGSYIPSMFPIANSTAKYIPNKVKGQCRRNIGYDRNLLKDIDFLERAREQGGYSKIVAIVPEAYFDFHKILDEKGNPAVGAIIRPRWETWKWFWLFGWHKYKSGFLGGSWNVLFVADDQHNQRTVAHELAHTLGQGREFYDSREMCRQFKGDSLKPCTKYEIPWVLDVFYQDGKQIWSFEENRYSIVGNEGNIKSQWIDRETHQKSFLTLSKFGAVVSKDIDLFEETKNQKKAKTSNIYELIFSGFYDKNRNKFIVPALKIQKAKKPSPRPPKIKKGKIPLITIQLKEKDEILDELKYPVLELEQTAFYKDGTKKTTPFPFSHVMASFKLPGNYREKILEFVVLDPKGRKIYSAFIPKDWKKRRAK